MEMLVGKFEVYTSNNGGHPAEFYAEKLCNRIITVADTAPEPIRAQALHYRDTMYLLILETIKSAMASERSTVMAEISKG